MLSAGQRVEPADAVIISLHRSQHSEHELRHKGLTNVCMEEWRNISVVSQKTLIMFFKTMKSHMPRQFALSPPSHS